MSACCSRNEIMKLWAYMWEDCVVVWESCVSDQEIAKARARLEAVPSPWTVSNTGFTPGPVVMIFILIRGQYLPLSRRLGVPVLGWLR